MVPSIRQKIIIEFLRNLLTKSQNVITSQSNIELPYSYPKLLNSQATQNSIKFLFLKQTQTKPKIERKKKNFLKASVFGSLIKHSKSQNIGNKKKKLSMILSTANSNFSAVNIFLQLLFNNQFEEN